MDLYDGVVIVSEQVIKEERERKKKIENEDKVEVIVIPPSKEGESEKITPEERPPTEEGKSEEVKEVKKLKISSPTPHFDYFERIVEKKAIKEIHLKEKESLIRMVNIPKSSFISPSKTVIKPNEKDLVMPREPMYEIIAHLLKNIPEIEFEKVKENILRGINTSRKEKLETIAEKVQNFLSIPRIIFAESGKIKKKSINKDTFWRATKSVDIGIPSTEEIKEGIEFKEPMEFIFDSGLGRLNIERPLIILAKKPKDEFFSYIELLKRILREIYRIRGKGLPKPTHVTTEDFEEIKYDIKADKSVWVFDLDDVKIEEKYFKDRLREIFSQNFGFLVLYGSEESINEVKELIEKLDSPFPRTSKVYIKEDDTVFLLTHLIWGIPKETLDEPIVGNLDATAVRLENLYYDKIEELVNKVENIVSIEPSSEDEENIGGESVTHFALKAFVVEHLTKNKGIKKSRIRTEYELAEGKADVFVSDPELGELAIEIETLYGTAIPMLKLRKRIDSRLEKGLKLWILVPNLQLLLYFKDIFILRNIYRRRYGDKIEFYGLDFDSGEILPITKFLYLYKAICY